MGAVGTQLLKPAGVCLMNSCSWNWGEELRGRWHPAYRPNRSVRCPGWKGFLGLPQSSLHRQPGGNKIPCPTPQPSEGSHAPGGVFLPSKGAGSVRMSPRMVLAGHMLTILSILSQCPRGCRRLRQLHAKVV